jgi:hypothetical protein
MVHWYESSVDRQLREAQERGEFDNLEGLGKPLRDAGREYDEDWWVKDWLHREGSASGALPATLALRREVQDLDQIVDRLRFEAAVRERVAEINERIRRSTPTPWCAAGANGAPASSQLGSVMFSGSACRVSARTKARSILTSVNQSTGRVSGGGDSGVKTTGIRPKSLPSKRGV